MKPRLGWIFAVLLLATAAVVVSIRRVPPGPVFSVDTTGFDPLIASAIREAEQAARTAPRSADARGGLGMVLLAHELRAPAAECFEQAVGIAPREPRWRYYLGLSQMFANPMAAATNFERAIVLQPSAQSAVRLRLADTLLSLGRLDEAASQYKVVLEKEPNSARARLGLGKIENLRVHEKEAVELLSSVAQDPCTRKAAQRLLLNIAQRVGRTNEAQQLSKTLAQLPNDKPFDDPWLEQVQQLKTGEAAWTEQADEWIKAGRVADAARLLEKTLQSYPKSDRAMLFLGRARLRVGDSAGAEAILQRAVELAPESVEAQVQLGVIKLARGRPKDAQKAFRAAIQAKPNLAEAWFNLGLALGNESRTESLAAFREAIRLKPGFVEAYLGLAVVLRAQGQGEVAAAELHRALALDPDEISRQKVLAQLKLLENR